MNILEFIQTILLIILVDRSLLIRNRYKLAFEFVKYQRGMYTTDKWYFAIWIYCKKGQEETYWRSGGKRLFHITKKIKQ